MHAALAGSSRSGFALEQEPVALSQLVDVAHAPKALLDVEHQAGVMQAQVLLGGALCSRTGRTLSDCEIIRSRSPLFGVTQPQILLRGASRLVGLSELSIPRQSPGQATWLQTSLTHNQLFVHSTHGLLLQQPRAALLPDTSRAEGLALKSSIHCMCAW